MSHSSYLFGAIVALILSIIALGFTTSLVTNNASAQQNQLFSNVLSLAQLIQTVETRMNDAIVAQALIPVKNAEYQTCLNEGNAECQAKVAQEQQLNNLAQQVSSATINCTNGTTSMVNLIQATTINGTNYTITTSGIMNVTVAGSSSPPTFSLPYMVVRTTIGGLRLYHLRLPAWSFNVTSIGTTITYAIPSPFCQWSDRKPLYDWYAFSFTSGWVTGYQKSCGNVIVYLYGSGNGTVRQVRDVSLFL